MKAWLIGPLVVMLLCACNSERNTGAVGGGKPDQRAVSLISDYKKSVIGLIAGQYGGACHGPAGASFQDGLTVNGSGIASAAGWQVDLMSQTRMFVLSRSLHGDAPQASFFVSGHEPQWSLELAGGGKPADNKVGAVRCTDLPKARAVGTHSVYGAIAPFLVRSALGLNCVSAAGVRKSIVRIARNNVQVDDRVFSLVRDVRAEHVHVDMRSAKLIYTAEYADDRHLVIGVDAGGNIAEVLVNDSVGDDVCVPPA